MRFTKNIDSILSKNLFKSSSIKKFISIFFIFQLFLFVIVFINKSKLYRSYKFLQTINLPDINKYLKELLFSYDFANEIKDIYIDIDLENSLILDCLRKRNKDCDKSWAKANLKNNNKKFNIKLKAKGERNIHRTNFKNMSFKVDIKGPKRLFGMEEFSLQDPIMRNYSNEFLISNIMRKNQILSPRNYLVRLFINGEYIGLRHLEESYSRELIEFSKKRYGPIYSIEKEESDIFGQTKFRVLNNKSWLESKNNIYLNGEFLLNSSQSDNEIIKKYFDIKKWAEYFALNDIFFSFHGNIPKSVRFFLNPTTGKIEPSFYDGHSGMGNFKEFLTVDIFNKTKNCDWLCTHRYWFKSFFFKDEIFDNEFYFYYYNALEKYSSNDYLKNVIYPEIDSLSEIRGALYRNISMLNGTYFKGLFPHVFSISSITNRIEYVRKMIEDSKTYKPELIDLNSKEIILINRLSSLPQVFSLFCEGKEFQTIVLPQGKLINILLEGYTSCNKNITYSINNGLDINKFQKKENISNDILKKELEKIKPLYLKQKVFNKKSFMNRDFFEISKDTLIENQSYYLNNKKIKYCLKNNSSLIFKNVTFKDISNSSSIQFINCDKNSGSVIIENSLFSLNQISVNGLKPSINNLRILYSGFNTINSKLNVNKIFITKNSGEDNINFINSYIKSDLIEVQDAPSDAIDSDYSEISVKKIICQKIGNDCFDTSFSNSEIGSIIATEVKDKVISAGESSNLKINSLKIDNSEMGIVSKDSSKVFINLYDFSKVKVPLVAFIKKSEFKSPSLVIEKINEGEKKAFLISEDAFVKINNKILSTDIPSSKISSMLYGKIYGVKTER